MKGKEVQAMMEREITARKVKISEEKVGTEAEARTGELKAGIERETEARAKAAEARVGARRGREVAAAITGTVAARREAEVAAEVKGRESGNTADTGVAAKEGAEGMAELVVARREIRNLAAEIEAAVMSLLVKRRTP